MSGVYGDDCLLLYLLLDPYGVDLKSRLLENLNILFISNEKTISSPWKCIPSKGCIRVSAYSAQF